MLAFKHDALRIHKYTWKVISHVCMYICVCTCMHISAIYGNGGNARSFKGKKEGFFNHLWLQVHVLFFCFFVLFYFILFFFGDGISILCRMHEEWLSDFEVVLSSIGMAQVSFIFYFIFFLVLFLFCFILFYFFGDGISILCRMHEEWLSDFEVVLPPGSGVWSQAI